MIGPNSIWLVSFKKGKQGHTKELSGCVCTEERPCDDTVMFLSLFLFKTVTESPRRNKKRKFKVYDLGFKNKTGYSGAGVDFGT